MIFKLPNYSVTALIISSLLMASCASNAPASKKHNGAILTLCKGSKTSNAPTQNSNGRIKNYEPIQTINRVQVITNPVVGQSCLSSGFGRRKGGAGSHHKGIDIATRTPSPILAAADGKITFIGREQNFGRYIEILHANKVSTRYAHLSEFSKTLKKGASIKAGTIIGKTGKSGNATGIHLHYEILIKGKQRNPLNF